MFSAPMGLPDLILESLHRAKQPLNLQLLRASAGRTLSLELRSLFNFIVRPWKGRTLGPSRGIAFYTVRSKVSKPRAQCSENLI